MWHNEALNTQVQPSSIFDNLVETSTPISSLGTGSLNMWHNRELNLKCKLAQYLKTWCGFPPPIPSKIREPHNVSPKHSTHRCHLAQKVKKWCGLPPPYRSWNREGRHLTSPTHTTFVFFQWPIILWPPNAMHINIKDILKTPLKMECLQFLCDICAPICRLPSATAKRTCQGDNYN
jgi:hypothetical protein